MNKKLYFLNEDEKNRILNLHESATKKQYLLGEAKLTNNTYGISDDAVLKILQFSDDNKKKFSGSLLFQPQQQEIDKKFGQGTYSKFVAAGGESLLKGKKSNQAKPEQTKRPIGWDNYPCVVKKGGKDITLTYKGKNSKWKMLVGTNNKTYYYNDKGQYYVEGQNILGNYECGYDGGIYRLGESPKKPEISYDKKNWYVTNKKYSDEIKSALNLDPKTMLSDKDIETIYNKLVEKGMIK